MLKTNYNPPTEKIQPDWRPIPQKLILKYGPRPIREGIAALERRRRLLEIEKATLKGGRR